jgi:archaellum component FlaG (FlaF/FlaG flagellin family)
MNTNKAILLFLALCVSSTVLVVDAKAGTSPGPNLGVIPDNYQLTYGPGPQIIFLDYNVVRTVGKPSIRLERHTAADVNTMREVDGTWYSIKPGDHIVAKVWIKTTVSNLGDTDYRDGGRIGIDFYAHTSVGYSIVDSADSSIGDTPTAGSHIPVGNCVLNWNNPTWTQKGWDIIVPTAQYTQVKRGGTVQAINPVQIDSFVVWFDGRPVGDTGLIWFADGEIYINPNFTSTAPAPPPPPLPQNVQIAVSSLSASSNDGYHVPNMAIDGIENPSNYWGTDATVPQGRVPQWLKLDLGTAYSINTVITHFYDGSVRTYTYYIQVSNDGSSWTTIVPTKTGSGSVTDTFSQVGARFVRITVTANTANPAAHIEEIKVYGSSSGPTPPPPSSGQIAVSSVSASSNDGYHVPNMAIDGIENPSNYWGTDATVPQGRVPQWLKLDLGTAYSINTVITHFYDGSVRTYTYYIQVSNDGSSWTMVVPARSGSGSVTDTFSQVGARFVRITVTANTANPAAHIEEIKVYGSS